MKWVIDRLREDNTRSAIGQLSLWVILIAAVAGVDVQGLIDRANASIASVGVALAAAAGLYVQIQRILTPQPTAVPVPVAVPPAVIEAVQGVQTTLAAMPGLDHDALAEKVADRLIAAMDRKVG